MFIWEGRKGECTYKEIGHIFAMLFLFNFNVFLHLVISLTKRIVIVLGGKNGSVSVSACVSVCVLVWLSDLVVCLLCV